MGPQSTWTQGETPVGISAFKKEDIRSTREMLLNTKFMFFILSSASDPSQSQQVSNPSMHILEDVKPKTLPLDKNINHQIESPGERRKWVAK